MTVLQVEKAFVMQRAEHEQEKGRLEARYDASIKAAIEKRDAKIDSLKVVKIFMIHCEKMDGVWVWRDGIPTCLCGRRRECGYWRWRREGMEGGSTVC